MTRVFNEHTLGYFIFYPLLDQTSDLWFTFGDADNNEEGIDVCCAFAKLLEINIQI